MVFHIKQFKWQEFKALRSIYYTFKLNYGETSNLIKLIGLL